MKNISYLSFYRNESNTTLNGVRLVTDCNWRRFTHTHTHNEMIMYAYLNISHASAFINSTQKYICLWQTTSSLKTKSTSVSVSLTILFSWGCFIFWPNVRHIKKVKGAGGEWIQYICIPIDNIRFDSNVSKTYRGRYFTF